MAGVSINVIYSAGWTARGWATLGEGAVTGLSKKRDFWDLCSAQWPWFCLHLELWRAALLCLIYHCLRVTLELISVRFCFTADCHDCLSGVCSHLFPFSFLANSMRWMQLVQRFPAVKGPLFTWIQWCKTYLWNECERKCINTFLKSQNVDHQNKSVCPGETESATALKIWQGRHLPVTFFPEALTAFFNQLSVLRLTLTMHYVIVWPLPLSHELPWKQRPCPSSWSLGWEFRCHSSAVSL